MSRSRIVALLTLALAATTALALDNGKTDREPQRGRTVTPAPPRGELSPRRDGPFRRPPSPRTSCAIATSSPQAGGAMQTTFSAIQIIDMDVSVLFRPAAGPELSATHTVEVKLFSPSGNLYQTLVSVVSSNSGRRDAHVAVPGMRRPLRTQELELIDVAGQPMLQAKARLPVAGTHIVTSSLYGTWKAQAFLDGATTPCGPEGSFVVQP